MPEDISLDGNTDGRAGLPNGGPIEEEKMANLRMPGLNLLSKFNTFRKSKSLVVVCFFLAVYTDCSAINLVQALAPAVLKRFYYTTECNCTNSTPSVKPSPTPLILRINLTSRHGIHGIVYPAMFCHEAKTTTCVTEPEIMTRNALMVGTLASIGPIVELLLTPIVKVLCAKFGYRFFLIGAGFIQFSGSFLFMFATNHAHLMIARGAFQGTVSTIVSIAGIIMVSKRYWKGAERKAIGLVYCIAPPLSAMTIYPAGNAGFQVTGPFIPFGIAAVLGFFSLLIRLVVLSWKNKDDDHGYDALDEVVGDEVSRAMDDKLYQASKQQGVDNEAFDDNQVGNDKITLYHRKEDTNYKRKGSESKDTTSIGQMHTTSYGTYDDPDKNKLGDYDRLTGSEDGLEPGDGNTKVPMTRLEILRAVLADRSVLIILIVSFIQCVGVSCIAATSPNWLINVARAQQYQVGVIFGICGAVQLILNLLCGRFVTKERLWLVALLGNTILTAALFIYPHCTSVWWALIPEVFYRAAAGIIFGVSSKMLSLYLEQKYVVKGCVEFGATWFAGVTTGGAATGALIGGVLIFNNVTYTNMYIPLAVFILGCSVGPFYFSEKFLTSGTYRT